MVAANFIVLLALTCVTSVLALISAAAIVYRLVHFERRRLVEAQAQAFKLFDEMFRSYIPRNLTQRMAAAFKVQQSQTVPVETINPPRSSISSLPAKKTMAPAKDTLMLPRMT
ncbi:hypothetical protein AAVH_04464 [Aphelenchoides avenae]|nr:hypothetical protein AAVH_04464 [Aphelenchus avenae]